MKNFIKKTLFFLAPILLLLIVTEMFYHTDKGDLIRFGYIFDTGTYYDNVKASGKVVPSRYTPFSRLNIESQNKFTLLTIGDSFSERGKYGYKNYLANAENVSVLHIDRSLSKNQLQTLIALSNGDFFEKIKVNYVILQIVERGVIKLNENITFEKTLNIGELQKEGETKILNSNQHHKYNLFSDRIFKIPLVNLLYIFDDNPKYSSTYKVKTNKKYFTGKNDKLLFVNEDIQNLSYNNDFEAIDSFNKTLSTLHQKLKTKGVQLIFLPAPDKYSIYYNAISEKEKYPKPLFFEYFNTLPKEYCYLNTYEIITKLINTEKDVYYYDDTHWTPRTSEFIAEKLTEKIKEN
jgi:hypothetical protein